MKPHSPRRWRSIKAHQQRRRRRTDASSGGMRRFSRSRRRPIAPALGGRGGADADLRKRLWMALRCPGPPGEKKFFLSQACQRVLQGSSHCDIREGRGKKKGKRTGDGIKQASCAQDSVKSAFKSHPGSRLPCAEGSWGRAIRPGLARPKLENSHFRPLTNVTGTSAPRTSRRDSLYPPGIVPQRPSRAASVTSAGWAIFPPCGISDITFLS